MNALRTHPDVEAIWLLSDALRRGYWLKIALDTGLGLVFLTGGSIRVSTPGFATLRELGSWPVWSALLLGLAVALLVGRTRGPSWLRVADWVAAALYAIMSVAFLAAALASPTAALTGAVSYMFIALTHVSQSFAYRPGETNP